MNKKILQLEEQNLLSTTGSGKLHLMAENVLLCRLSTTNRLFCQVKHIDLIMQYFYHYHHTILLCRKCYRVAEKEIVIND